MCTFLPDVSYNLKEMVEIPSCLSYRRYADTKTFALVSIDYSQEYTAREPITVALRKIRPKNVVQKSSTQEMKQQIDKPIEKENIFGDRRLNNILQMCLELHDLGDRLSLTSPKDFVVQYFSVSQNCPVKVCCRSQCPFAAQSMRIQETRQQPTCSGPSRCKRNEITTQDKFSNCFSPLNEIHDVVAESIPRGNLSKRANGSKEDHETSCGSLRRGCNSPYFTSRCSSRMSGCVSSKVNKRHSSQQTEPEQSWQSRCSNFIINLPLTLSNKFFGPRITCEAFTDGNRTVCNNDSRPNGSHLTSNDSSQPGSKDQDNKKSVKLRTTSLADSGCYKNIATDGVCLEKAERVDPCHSRTSQSVKKSVTCGSSGLESEESSVTCKKVTPKCGKFGEDSSTQLEISVNDSYGAHSQGSDPHEPTRLKCGAKNHTSCSISERKKRERSALSFSNWPAILSHKFFGHQNAKISQRCVVNDKISREETKDGATDSPRIISEAGSPSAATKGRLLLKKYTISQTPETMEETLCFDVLAEKQLSEPKTELESQVCVKMISDNEQKLETVQEWNDSLDKCSKTGKSYTSERCVKSRGNLGKSISKKKQQLEKNTSTEHIFFSNLIMKLLNRHNDDRGACESRKCYRNIGSGRNSNKRDQHERKYTSKRRNDIASRKCSITSVYKQRNKTIICPNYMAKDSRKNEAVLCALEQNVSLDCCAVDASNVPGTDQTQRKILSDYSSGRNEVSGRGNVRTYLSGEDLQDVRDLCKTVTQIMTHDYMDQFEERSNNKDDCQGCDTPRSSKVNSLIKSGVLQVIDDTYPTKAKQLPRLLQKNHEAQSNVREKCVKKISSPDKFAYRVRRRNVIEKNRSQLDCGSCHDGALLAQQRKLLAERICVRKHRDRSISKKGFENCNALKQLETFTPENYDRNDVINFHRKRRPQQQCRREQSSAEKLRKTYLTGENICVNVFCDRETSTDGLSESARGKNCECLEEQKRNKYTFDEDVDASVNRDLDSQGLSRSTSQRDSSPLEQNNKGSTQKQLENVLQVRVDCKDCAGSPCEDDTTHVSPWGIPRDDNFLETEHDASKVLSSLWQEAREEREKTAYGSETHQHKALNKAETKEELRMLNGDKLCQRQHMAVHSPADICSLEEKSQSINEPSKKNKDTDDNRQLLKLYPVKSDQMDGVQSKIDSPEKQSSWIISGKGLSVTKPESRNIINSYYCQRKIEAASSRETRRDEYGKAKKGKAQQNGSALDKSIIKVRKPFQRIENVRQVGRTANVVVKADRSKKRQVAEKENSIANKKGPFIPDGSVFDDELKNYLVQSVTNDGLSLPNRSIASPTENYALSIRALERTDAVNPQMQVPPLEDPEKLGPSKLRKSKTPQQASVFATKVREISNAKLKERLHKTESKKKNSRTPSRKIDAIKTAQVDGKIAARAGSEFSNRLTRSIDICDAKGSEGHKELKDPVYIFNKENVRTRTLQIEMSNVKEQIFPTGAIIKGTSRIEKGPESSESSKSSSSQRHGEHKEDERNLTIASARTTRENKHTKENQSKSGAASKKNEKDKKSTPEELLSRSDSEIDANSITQERVTANADLVTDALMDEKKNIKNYHDIQSVGQKNRNFNRTATSKNGKLQKSGTATARSKPQVLAPSNSSKTSAKKTHEKSKNGKNTRHLKETASNTAENVNIANKDDTKGALNISPANVHNENSNEGLNTYSQFNKVDVTRESLSIHVNSAETSRATTCNDEGNRMSENDTLLKNIANEKNVLKNNVISSSPQASSDSNQKTQQGAGSDTILRGKSTRCKSHNHGNISKSNYTEESQNTLADVEKEEIRCSTERAETKNKSNEAISDMRDSLVSKVKCKKSTSPICNSLESKRLCESFHISSNEEKEIVQHEYDNVPEKLSTRTSERIISDSSTKNFCFTDDLKRFLHQRQEYFTPKKSRNCNLTTLNNCSDVEHESTLCVSSKSKESRAWYKGIDFCKNVDYQKLKRSSGICDEEHASNNSILSLQKAYSALKTILNKTKNIHKGFMNAKETKGTQIYTPASGQSSTLIEDCVKFRKSKKYPESKISKGNESLTVSISFGSSIFSDSNLPACTEKNKKLNCSSS